MKKMIRKTLPLLALGCALLAAASSHAATTTLQYQGATYPNYQNFNITAVPDVGSSSTKSVAAGGFNMKNTATGGSLIAWCLDVFNTLANTFTYTNSNSGPSTPNVNYNTSHASDLQSLVDQRYSLVNSATRSAAFQLAVWEIVTENGNTYGLGSGDFKVNSGNATAIALANDWLKLDSNKTGSYKIDFFIDNTNKSTQDLISVSAVPLPGAAVLMLSALGLGGLFSRRRKLTAA